MKKTASKKPATKAARVPDEKPEVAGMTSPDAQTVEVPVQAQPSNSAPKQSEPVPKPEPEPGQPKQPKPLAGKAVAFATFRDTPGKADAREFQREARRFLATVSPEGKFFAFDNSLAVRARRQSIVDGLGSFAPGTLDTVAFFCHGWKSGIQAGFSTETVGELVEAVKRACVKAPTVLLYCCSTAADDDNTVADEREPGPGGDGGFADELRDALAAAGVEATVYGHTTRGHTTINPYMRRFSPGTSKGGEWVVEPRTRDFFTWANALNFHKSVDGKVVEDKSNRFRFQFPFPSEVV